MKFWKSYNQLQLFYKSEKYNLEDVTNDKLSKLSFSFSSNNSFNLNERKTVSAELNYYYISDFLSQGIVFKARQKIDLGLKTLFFNKKISGSIYLSDVFKSFKTKGKSVSVNNISPLFDNYYDIQSIKFSFRYNFGKKLNNKKRKQSNSDEKKRIR